MENSRKIGMKEKRMNFFYMNMLCSYQKSQPWHDWEDTVFFAVEIEKERDQVNV